MKQFAPSQQRGVVLLTTVMLLVMLTILALAAVSMGSTQTRVAANSADSMVAYQTAEGALAQATTGIINGTYSDAAFLANGNGLYVFSSAASPVWKNPATWSSANAALTGFTGGSSAPAAFVIEKLPSVIRPGQNMKSQTRIYRITARAVGKSGGSPVILQTTVSLQ